jgi:hypothetical protein
MEQDNRKKHLFYILIISMIFIIVVIGSLFWYLSYSYKIGEFVYKEDGETKIGKIKSASFPLSYVIEWEQGNYTQESLFDINKISDLNSGKIRNFFQDNGLEDYFYKEDINGKSIILSEQENFSSVSETAVLGVGGNTPIKLKDDECMSVFVCGNWGKCEVEYDLHKLIRGNYSVGVRHRHCKDYSECMSDFIDSRSCKVKNNIILKNIKQDGKEYVEIYDEENRLIVKINKTEIDNIDKLDIEFLI